MLYSKTKVYRGIYIIFLISAQKHRMCVRVRSVRMSTHNQCLEHKYEEYQNFYVFFCFFFSFFYTTVVFIIIIIIFIISAKKHRLWYAFKPPRRVPTMNVWSRNMKNIRFFYLAVFIFFYGKIINIFEQACFQVLLVCV